MINILCALKLVNGYQIELSAMPEFDFNMH